MEVKTVLISDLKTNDWNANEMTANQLDHLTKTIDRINFLQDIIVWDNKESNKYIVVDGEHRFRALKKTDINEVPCKILSNEDLINIGKKLILDGELNIPINELKDNLEVIAKTITVLMNEIKGENNPIKFGKLIQSLRPAFNLDQLSKIFNKNEQEFTKLLQFLEKTQKEDDKLIKALANKNKETLNEYKFILNEEQTEILEKALDIANKDNNTDGLMEICNKFIKSNPIKIS